MSSCPVVGLIREWNKGSLKVILGGCWGKTERSMVNLNLPPLKHP